MVDGGAGARAQRRRRHLQRRHPHPRPRPRAGRQRPSRHLHRQARSPRAGRRARHRAGAHDADREPSRRWTQSSPAGRTAAGGHVSDDAEHVGHAGDHRAPRRTLSHHRGAQRDLSRDTGTAGGGGARRRRRRLRGGRGQRRAAATVSASCRWCARRATAPHISSTPPPTRPRVVPRVHRVGVTSGASTPTQITRAVIAALEAMPETA